MRGRDLVGFVGLADMALNMGNVARKWRNAVKANQHDFWMMNQGKLDGIYAKHGYILVVILDEIWELVENVLKLVVGWRFC